MNVRMKVLLDKRNQTVHRRPVDPRSNIAVGMKASVAATGKLFMDVFRADGSTEHIAEGDQEPPAQAPATSGPSDVTVEYRWHFDEIPGADVNTVCRECLKEMSGIVSEWETLLVR